GMVWSRVRVLAPVGANAGQDTDYSRYKSAHPEDRDAFPTRRSSDLNVRTSQYVAYVANVNRVASVNQWFKFWGWQKGVVRFRLRDRKSTRLNSSHVSISYAVFCLKKNK